MEKDLSKEILEKIKKDQIKPKSKWLFLLRDYVVWFVFAFSIILGALSFSIILHFWEINDWDAYYRVNENFVAFVALTMPYFWLAAFLVFILLAFFYLKHTRTGYRLEFAKVVFLNLVLSFAGGAVLYSIGAGRQAESELARRAPFYNDIRNGQESIWLRPEQGVIVGKVIEIQEDSEVIELGDPHQIVWTVDTSDVQYFHGFVVREGYMIKVFGERCDTDNCFIAEEIRPLLRERGPRIGDNAQKKAPND